MVAPTGEGKALEAWVLLKLANTVRRQMNRFWRVALRQGDGTNLPAGSTFNFPSQRSRIQPSSATAHGYVLIEHKSHTKRRFDFRGRIQWEGRRGEQPEIAVSRLHDSKRAAYRQQESDTPHRVSLN